LFVFQPLPNVKTMYYLDVNFYRYLIGREDQSVHEDVMIRRIDQQLHVNKLMIDGMIQAKVEQKGLRRYMTSYLNVVTAISSIMLIRSGTDENFQKKQELWKYLKNTDGRLYMKLKFGLLGRCLNLPGKRGRRISVAMYRVVQKFYGFN